MITHVKDYNYKEFAKYEVQHRKRGNQGTRNRKTYIDYICAFDIETTNDPEIEQAYMYIWQFQIEDTTIYGRTWQEFYNFLNKIITYLDPNEYLVIFVHNLSYEFQFLSGIYDFEPEEVFAVDSRKVLKCEMLEHFEFRCSYLQTNMSLAEFTAKMGVEHGKLSGEEFDYSKIRYPWTELTPRELEYCFNDVIGLVEAMRVQIELEHDNFYTLPLTSTGYVRRDVKHAMKRGSKYREFKNQLPTYEIYTMLREAFRGGNTHGNRFYTGEIIENVHSYDYASSYPNVQINMLFPMSPWLKEDPGNVDRCLNKIYKQRRACLMRVAFWDLELNDPRWGCPYIPKAKSRNARGIINDNGRVISAEYLEITLTDIDFKIIQNEYKYSYIEFIDFYHSRYGKLPQALKNVILDYFRTKTDLKGVDGQELYYMKSKNKLNSIYGMSVQSPVRQEIDYMNGEFIQRSEDEARLLTKANRKAFMQYAWGVWTTAHARSELEEALKHVEPWQFVYCDTDSIKYVGECDWEPFNRTRRARSEKNGAAADDRSGERHYLGVLEHDAEYDRFITLGAKKYAFEEAGKIGITVAGVGKKAGAEELKEAGGLEAFKEGLTFRKAGGTEAKYNDDPEIKSIIREGRKIEISSNLYISDSQYTLGITGEYRRLLDYVGIWKRANDFH